MPESQPRKSILWCARCRRPQSTLVYLSDGNHYCWDCADLMHRTRGLQAVGKRPDDIDPWDAATN